MLMNRKKLIFKILKELQDGQEPKQVDNELDLQQWGEIAELIKGEGLAKGINVLYGDDEVQYVEFSSPKITMKGIEFLEENSVRAKAYKTIKEGRDWLKL